MYVCMVVVVIVIIMIITIMELEAKSVVMHRANLLRPLWIDSFGESLLLRNFKLN